MTLHEEAIIEYVIDKLIGLEVKNETFKNSLISSIKTLENLIKSQHNKRRKCAN